MDDKGKNLSQIYEFLLKIESKGCDIQNKFQELEYGKKHYHM